MAEQTPPSNDDSSNILRKRTHQEKQSGDPSLTPGQRSLPPQRGLLKRSKGSAPSRTGAERRPARRPITRDQAAPKPSTPSSHDQILTPPSSPFAKSPPPSPSQKAAAPVRRPAAPDRPASKRGPVDVTGIGSRQAKGSHDRRLLAAEEKRKADAERKRLEEEKIAKRQAEREKRQKMRELAAKKAEEERIRQQKELERKKAEAERIRLEKAAEAKRLEDERLKKEKEEELKRLEELKVFQAAERQRIFKTIETCRGVLSEKEETVAKTIADEMVKRNIQWEGYISLHSGIGGSMLS